MVLAILLASTPLDPGFPSVAVASTALGEGLVEEERPVPWSGRRGGWLVVWLVYTWPFGSAQCDSTRFGNNNHLNIKSARKLVVASCVCHCVCVTVCVSLCVCHCVWVCVCACVCG